MPLAPVQAKTGTSAWHWSRFELPGPRGALVPVRLGALVPVHAKNRDQSSRAGPRGMPRSFGPGSCQEPGPIPLPCLYIVAPTPLSPLFFFPGLVGSGGASFFSLCHAQDVFDEMPEPHLSSHKMISSTEVSNFIIFICN